MPTPATITIPPAPQPAPVEAVQTDLRARLSSLYGHAQQSAYVFGSPLGPFFHHAAAFHVPRFAYFGPNTTDASVRLAVLSGYSSQSLPGTLALIAFIQRLALNPEIGHSLNLSFFPIVDVLGTLGDEAGRALGNESWTASSAPELALLEKDARLRAYQGFIRIETNDDDVITAELRAGHSHHSGATEIELIASDDFGPWPVRFQGAAAHAGRGSLALSEDLPFAPFELTVAVPRAWPQPFIDRAVAHLLKRFIVRYRGLQAYGQHL